MKTIVRLACTLGICAALCTEIQSTTAFAATPDCTRPAPEQCPGKDCPVECKGGTCPAPESECRDDIVDAVHDDSGDSHDFDSYPEPPSREPVDAVEPTNDADASDIDTNTDIES